MEERTISADTLSYWRRFASAFASPLRANGELGAFTANPAVTGAYAEAWLRALISTMVSSLRISTGAIIRTSDELKQTDLRRIPQTDIILWDPTVLPPLFANNGFALIHTQGARGIIEIKRTLGTRKKVAAQLAKQRLRLLSEYRQNVLGVVIADSKPLHKVRIHEQWVSQLDPHDDVPIVRLLDRNSSEADTDGIFGLIYFLAHMARDPRCANSSEDRVP